MSQLKHWSDTTWKPVSCFNVVADYTNLVYFRQSGQKRDAYPILSQIGSQPHLEVELEAETRFQSDLTHVQMLKLDL